MPTARRSLGREARSRPERWAIACLVLILALGLSCPYPRLRVSAGTATQGDVGMTCKVRWNGSFHGAPCAARPQIELSAESDCTTTGDLWFSIDDPPESRLVVPHLKMQLKQGEEASFPGPCFTKPNADGAPLIISLRASCKNEEVAATTRCVMP